MITFIYYYIFYATRFRLSRILYFHYVDIIKYLLVTMANDQYSTKLDDHCRIEFQSRIHYKFLNYQTIR